VCRGHNSKATRRNSKVIRIKNGRLKEDAGPQTLEGESHWDNSSKAGHHGLKTINLTKKGSGVDSYATGTEGN
jgi:hypothetical protein